MTDTRLDTIESALDDFREEMLHDHHMRVMVDFTNSKDCFTNADIAGGVNYFLWDKGYSGPCTITNVSNAQKVTLSRSLDEFAQYGVFVRSNNACSIVHKATQNNPVSLSSIVSTRNPFGLNTDQRGKKLDREGSMTLSFIQLI